MRDLFHEHIPDEEQLEQFGLWAFGSEYRELDQGLNFMKAWNDLHADKLKLKPLGILVEDAPKMVQLWRDKISEWSRKG